MISLVVNSKDPSFRRVIERVPSRTIITFFLLFDFENI